MSTSTEVLLPIAEQLYSSTECMCRVRPVIVHSSKNFGKIQVILNIMR